MRNQVIRSLCPGVLTAFVLAAVGAWASDEPPTSRGTSNSAPALSNLAVTASQFQEGAVIVLAGDIVDADVPETFTLAADWAVSISSPYFLITVALNSPGPVSETLTRKPRSRKCSLTCERVGTPCASSKTILIVFP